MILYRGQFERNTHIRWICNSVTHLRSCPDNAHLQKYNPNSAKLLTNTVPLKGVNISAAIELDNDNQIYLKGLYQFRIIFFYVFMQLCIELLYRIKL